MSDHNSELKHVQNIAKAMRSLMDAQDPAAKDASAAINATAQATITPLSTLSVSPPIAASASDNVADTTPKGKNKKTAKPDEQNTAGSSAQKPSPARRKKSASKGKNSTPSNGDTTATAQSQSSASQSAASQSQERDAPRLSASPLSRLSLQLGRALADIRRNESALTAPQKATYQEMPPQLETLRASLDDCLFALEDEADQSRTAILEELGRFDSAQRRILNHAATLMTQFQEQANQWLAHETEALAAQKKNIAEKEALFKKIMDGQN